MVKLERFKESTTSDNILNWIYKQFDDFKFDILKFKGICCDGATSMTKLSKTLNSISESEFISIHCIAHRINVALKHVLSGDDFKIGKVLVEWFASRKVLTQFKNYIKDMKYNKPPRNCRTRWQYFADCVNYIVKNYQLIEDFLNEANNKNNTSIKTIKKIRTSFIQTLNYNNINYSIERNNKINIKGMNNQNISILRGLSIVLNIIKETIKVLESSQVFLSDGIRVIFSHLKLIFKIKSELQSKKGEIMNDFFEFNKRNRCNTNQQLLNFVNSYIEEYSKVFLNIFKIDTEIKEKNNFENFDEFMSEVMHYNIDNEFFQIFVSENPELFNINDEDQKLHEEFEKQKERYLRLQVVSPTTCNVECLFSTFKRHYHTNSSDCKFESTVKCSFCINDMGTNSWSYEKRFLFEDHLESLNRKRDG